MTRAWQAVFPALQTMNSGLEKREYFAAVALQGLLASNYQVELAAELAVKAAECLIDELNPPDESELEKQL